MHACMCMLHVYNSTYDECILQLKNVKFLFANTCALLLGSSETMRKANSITM